MERREEGRRDRKENKQEEEKRREGKRNKIKEENGAWPAMGACKVQPHLH